MRKLLAWCLVFASSPVFAQTAPETGFAAWLLGWFNAFIAWCVSIITSIFVSVWTMFTDALIYIFVAIFDLVTYIVSGMSWDFGGFSPVAYWNALPADLLNTLNLIGVPVALGLIVAALGIRFVIQIIPFVRWGS